MQRSKRKQLIKQIPIVFYPEVKDFFLYRYRKNIKSNLLMLLIKRGELPYRGLLKNRPRQYEQMNNVVLTEKLLCKLEGNIPVCL